MPVHRNRIIYQSEALFVSPDSTGAHFTGAKLDTSNTGAHGAIGAEVFKKIGTGPFGLVTPPTGRSQAFGTEPGQSGAAKNAKGNILGWQPTDTLTKWPEWNPTGAADHAEYADSHGSIIRQLKRVQTANYGFTVNRQDVNQFGHLGRLDSLIIEAPTVNLDFSYYLLDGYNERMLEFVTNGRTNALSGALAPELYQAGNNFFILTVPEARDAVNGDASLSEEKREDQKSVIALGNGFITDYTVDISVGAIPTASVTVEGMNIRSDFGTTGNDNPGIDINDGSLISNAWTGTNKREIYNGGCTGLYSLPASTSGYTGCHDISALRPGDVVVNMSNSAMMSKQTSGTNASKNTLQGSAHIQSVSINVPMARTTLQRLGNTFGFSKAVDVPVNVSMTVSAVLADLKESNLIDLMCKCEGVEVGVDLYKPECGACELKQGSPAMRYTLKGARLESENFTSTIGDNKTVEVTFTAQVGGPDDPANGLFISGAEPTGAGTHTVKGMPPAWTGLAGAEGKELPSDPVSGFLGYRA